jgi:formate hydrogenlyase subunit 4
MGAAMLMPLGPAGSSLSFRGDVLLLIYLLALARFCTAWAAMETGSAFEGMGAAREVSYAVLAEAAIITAVLTLSFQSGSTSLVTMLSPSAGAGAALLAAGLFTVLLAENCRVPFDDPNTHLELTMIHEVMVLDHSGPLFGCILYAAAIKLFVLGALFVNVLAPFSTGSPLADWGLFILCMMILAVVIGTVESVMARLRLVRIPQLLVAATILTAFSLVLVLR